MIDPELVKALDDAIEIHKRRAAGFRDPTKCPLCERADVYDVRTTCDSCPVRIYTGRSRCLGTPYYRADGWLGKSSPEEVAFLKWIRYLYLNGWLEVP